MIASLAFISGLAISGLLISALIGNLQRAVRLARERTEEVERLGRERLRLEREAAMARGLRDADRLKNALLNSIAHDLRSPIATLKLLSDPVAGFPPATALERVSEETHRLSEFIETLQRFAADGGAVALTIDTHDVAGIVETALRTCEARLASHTIEVHAGAEPPVLMNGDLMLSVHILGNLLQNAARYAPASEPIEIRTRAAGDYVEMVVADRGPGIADDDVARVFTGWRRPATSGTKAGDDLRLGIGLSIARTFARAQQGDLLYRGRDGGGSEFVLRLPRADGAATSGSRTELGVSPALAS